MIDIWLKIRDRGNPFFVLKNLNFWLGVFADKLKYRIWIYNENFVFPSHFAQDYSVYRFVTRGGSQNDNKECAELQSFIETQSTINNTWKKAAYALALPYFYLQDSETVLNIDADDMTLYGPIESYLPELLDVMKSNNLSVIAYDWLFSKNANSKDLPHHWTFGVAISPTKKMKDLVRSVIYARKSYGYAIVNLDYLVDMELKAQNPRYVCFTSQYDLSDGNWTTRYKPEWNQIECGFLANPRDTYRTAVHRQTYLLK